MGQSQVLHSTLAGPSCLGALGPLHVEVEPCIVSFLVVHGAGPRSQNAEALNPTGVRERCGVRLWDSQCEMSSTTGGGLYDPTLRP